MRLKLAIVALLATMQMARAAELIAVRPGVMCSSADALARLTLPDGSSREKKPGASLELKVVKREGICIDFVAGFHVEVLAAYRNTSEVKAIAQFSDNARTFLVPNIDFQPVAALPPTNGIESSPGGTTQAQVSPSTLSSLQAAAGLSDKEFQAPKLDGLIAAFINAKLTSIPPDFDDYAEKSDIYLKANSFNREATLAREKRRLQDLYNGIDTNSLYSMRVNVGLRQYDAKVAGFQLNWSDALYVPFSDPTHYQHYNVTLDNENSFGTIPIADLDEARAFVRNYRFSADANITNQVIYNVVVRINDSAPSDNTTTSMLRATIVAARVDAPDGRLIYQFLERDRSGAAPPSDANRATDIQGMHVGMPVQEAEAFGEKNWTFKDAAKGINGMIFANNHPPGQIVCGGQNNFDSTLDLQYTKVNAYSSPGTFSDYMTYTVDWNDATKVNSVFTDQINLNISCPDLMKMLTDKYGKPNTNVVGNNHEIVGMIWISHSNAPQEGDVRIQADFNVDQKTHLARLGIGASTYSGSPSKPVVSTPASTPKL